MHKVFKWKVCQRENGKKADQFAVMRGRWELRENEAGLSAKEGKPMKTMFRCIFHDSIGPINNRYKK